MNMSELIRKRRSVRTFDGTPLREEDAAAILEFASRAENPFGLPIGIIGQSGNTNTIRVETV